MNTNFINQNIQNQILELNFDKQSFAQIIPSVINLLNSSSESKLSQISSIPIGGGYSPSYYYAAKHFGLESDYPLAQDDLFGDDCETDLGLKQQINFSAEVIISKKKLSQEVCGNLTSVIKKQIEESFLEKYIVCEECEGTTGTIYVKTDSTSQGRPYRRCHP